jgi:uroporphyrinogen decarboxylase
MTLKPYLHKTSLKCFNLDSGERLDDYLDHEIAIQGNIDPQVFQKSENEIKNLADDIYSKYKRKNNYVCNLGSGITPDIDPNKVGLFLNRLRGLNSE